MYYSAQPFMVFKYESMTINQVRIELFKYRLELNVFLCCWTLLNNNN